MVTGLLTSGSGIGPGVLQPYIAAVKAAGNSATANGERVKILDFGNNYVELGGDNAHPDAAGYSYIGNSLAAMVLNDINATPTPTPTPTPTITPTPLPTSKHKAWSRGWYWGW